MARTLGTVSLDWDCKSLGWWEAVGDQHAYRAVQVGSRSWHLYVFGPHFRRLVAELSYPVTFSDCRSYAAQIETGKYVIQDGRAVKV